MGLLEDFYSTLMASEIKKVIIVKSENDIANNLVNATPIYDYFRNRFTGENVLDLTSLRGVEDLGDRIKILAGTKWRDVIRYNPEVWSVLDFSVGGSVYFSDEGFGFNEFGELSKRVEVEAYLNGEKYKGKYKGGVIYAVYVRKETKPLRFKKISGDLKFILSKIKSLLGYSPLPFRDISILIEKNNATLIVSYPEVREIIVKRFLEGFSDGEIPKFSLGDYKYIYVGKTSADNLDEKELEKATKAWITFRNKEAFYVILSENNLNFNLSTLNFNGCVLCGKCVEVCPHSSQKDSSVFSPLGFYVLSARNEESLVANCHMCGLCENVCPAKLDILSALKSKASLKTLYPKTNFYVPQKRSIVITAISEPLIQDIFKLIKFLSIKGVRVGIITLDESLDKLVKGEIDKEKARKLLEGVEEIITLTPEEAYYLEALKSVKILEITFAYTLLSDILNEMLKIKRIHYSCFYRRDAYNGCSYELLNLVNEEGYGSLLPNAEVTLCPLAARKLKIKSYVDLLGVNLDPSSVDAIYEEILKASSSISPILDDLSWYRKFDEKLFEDIVDNVISSAIQDKDYSDLLLFYLNIDKYNLEGELRDRTLKALKNALFGSSNKY